MKRLFEQIATVERNFRECMEAVHRFNQTHDFGELEILRSYDFS
jgi:hypothetical protein